MAVVRGLIVRPSTSYEVYTKLSASGFKVYPHHMYAWLRRMEARGEVAATEATSANGGRKRR